MAPSAKKPSKSKGTLIGARQYLEAGLDPEWLRFYFFPKINGASHDVDFSPQDFIDKVDSDLIGTHANIASRLAPFAQNQLNGVVSIDCSDHPLVLFAKSLDVEISEAFAALDFARAHRLIFSIVNEANKAINESKPWALAKNPAWAHELARCVCSGFCAFECLTCHLNPVIPASTALAFPFLNTLKHALQPARSLPPIFGFTACCPARSPVLHPRPSWLRAGPGFYRATRHPLSSSH